MSAAEGQGGINMKDSGRIIAQLRAEKKMTQKELAKILNLSSSAISNYENGVHTPDLVTLGKMADFFCVTIDYLSGRTGYRCSPKTFNEYITTEYTVTDFINTVISLDPDSRNSVTDYTDYIRDKQMKKTKPK
jgi:transcriptional regulator with XRE-family HTH domain